MSAGMTFPLRRLFLSTDAVGGVWQYSLELARGLAEQDIEVTLAVLGPAPSRVQLHEAATAGVTHMIRTNLPLEWTAESPEMLRQAADRLAELCAGSGAELAHLGNVAFGCADWPVPVVGTLHSCVATWWRSVKGGPLPPDLAWRADCIRAGLQGVATCIAPTTAFAALLGEVYGAALPPLRVVHNGRELPSRPARAKEPLVLTVGRLWDEAKNAAALDRAAAMIDYPVLAAGSVEGPTGQRFEADSLRLLGPLDGPALAERMAAAAVFASTAVYEPFGLAALEAARAGAALVLSDTPGFRELWDEAAVFVPPENTAAVAEALTRLLEEPARRRAFGEAAAQRAARYSRRSMVEGTLDAYRSALGRSTATVAA